MCAQQQAPRQDRQGQHTHCRRYQHAEGRAECKHKAGATAGCFHRTVPIAALSLQHGGSGLPRSPGIQERVWYHSCRDALEQCVSNFPSPPLACKARTGAHYVKHSGMSTTSDACSSLRQQGSERTLHEPHTMSVRFTLKVSMKPMSMRVARVQVHLFCAFFPPCICCATSHSLYLAPGCAEQMRSSMEEDEQLAVGASMNAPFTWLLVLTCSPDEHVFCCIPRGAL